MSQAWRPRTQPVHGGSRRSDFGETSEALFLTSGFRYRSAQEAADRFADREAGYMYSRLANPTVRMFEERLALLEGAEEAAATATGMAAVNAALMSQLRAGDRVVGARLAFGCNIGAYFSGIASGSLHGWLWFLAALLGTAVGVRCRPLFGLAERRRRA